MYAKNMTLSMVFVAALSLCMIVWQATNLLGALTVGISPDSTLFWFFVNMAMFITATVFAVHYFMRHMREAMNRVR